MSHAAPEPPSRRRVDRTVGLVLALVGIAVAVVAVLALQNPKGREASKATATVPPTSAATSHAPTTKAPTTKPRTSNPPTSATTAHGTTPLSAHPIPLIVLNNTSTPGLADTARTRFQQGGWTVTSVNNLNNDILSTCAYYDPNYPGAEQAAEQLQQQFPSIKRVKPKFDGLPDGPIVVVLTTDYS